MSAGGAAGGGAGAAAAGAGDAPARIGLEVHCQLTSLATKLFCPCPSAYRGMEPNTNVCPVCMGLPGTLPRLNRRAVEKAVMVAASLGCSTPERIAFFRKNYFYPDLPKNFQITQLDAYGPSSVGGGGGSVDIGGGDAVRVRRVQLEEDPGRIVYGGGSGSGPRPTLVDYNRAGTALVEIVTEPDMDSPRQARRFLGVLSDAVANIGAADPSLEGAMRADGNVSVGGGPRVEVKNVGSFHDLEKALHFEIARQRSLAGRGIPVEQETRHWDQGRRVTVPARKKEADMDYRYLLEADIPPVAVGAVAASALAGGMPEGVAARRARYASEIGLPAQVADVLSSDRFYSDLFDEARRLPGGGGARAAREIANMITTDLMGIADTREKRGSLRVAASHLADLAAAVESGSVTRASARDALHEAARSGMPVAEIVEAKGLGVVGAGDGEEGGGGELARVVRDVLAAESRAAEQARADPKAVNYLVGRVMAATSGRADPQQTLRLIREGLGDAAGGGGDGR